MEIKFKEVEDITKDLILEDMESVRDSLVELKRSIIALGDNDEDNEVYHRFCDTEDEESAYILKDISKMEEEVSVYEFVEDDKEYDAIAAIFKEIMDDVDFK